MEMLLSLSLSPLSEREKRGVGLLPEGLVCTENDLAFLQHVETIQQHQRLQVVIDIHLSVSELRQPSTCIGAYRNS